VAVVAAVVLAVAAAQLRVAERLQPVAHLPQLEHLRLAVVAELAAAVVAVAAAVELVVVADAVVAVWQLTRER
jgi:hypothetical protein